MDAWTWFSGANRRFLPHRDAGGTMSDALAIEDKAPSSVYRGEVFFFDSIEHRDMFNANYHQSVAIDSVSVTNYEQHDRRICQPDVG